MFIFSACNLLMPLTMSEQQDALSKNAVAPPIPQAFSSWLRKWCPAVRFAPEIAFLGKLGKPQNV